MAVGGELGGEEGCEGRDAGKGSQGEEASGEEASGEEASGEEASGEVGKRSWPWNWVDKITRVGRRAILDGPWERFNAVLQILALNLRPTAVALPLMF